MKFGVGVKGKLAQGLLFLLGIAFILQTAGSLALGMFGERGAATITHIRRELGERKEAVPNRYTYIISYSFMTPTGQTITDSTRRIGGALYAKASGKEQVQVRYFSVYPYINTLERDAQFSLGKAALLAVGAFLIAIATRTHRVSKAASPAPKPKSSRLQLVIKPTGKLIGGTIGYSDKISDPAFARYIRAASKWSLLFAIMLAVIVIGGFAIYGETSGEMGNPEALYIGFTIGGMFVAIALYQTHSRLKGHSWDGVVVEKHCEHKRRKRDSDHSTEEYTLYTVAFRCDAGKAYVIRIEDDPTKYHYFQIGDKVRWHKGLNSLEKYDKSNDSIVFCNACGSLNDIQDDVCFRCGCPLLK